MGTRRFTKRGQFVLATGLLALSSACDRPATDPDPVSVVDPAGVRQVNFPALADLDVEERVPHERFELGVREGTELFRVVGARLLPGGTLVVGNAGTHEILRVDEAGELVGRLGREGEGPGEFSDITTLMSGSADTLVVYDVRLGRLTTFDEVGNLVGTREMNPPSRVVDLEPLTLDPDGRVLSVFGDARFFAASGTLRDTTPLLVIDTTSRADTLGFWPNAEWAFGSFDGGSMRLPVGFGRALFASGRDGLALLGSSDALDVVLLDMAGDTLVRIRQTEPNRTVPAEDLARWRSERLADIPEERAERIREVMADAPHHETYPAFEGLLLDADGRIWIGHAPSWGAPEKTWTVFGTDGRPAWTLALPTSAEVLDARGSRVVVLHRDEFGVEIVRVYDVRGQSPVDFSLRETQGFKRAASPPTGQGSRD